MKDEDLVALFLRRLREREDQLWQAARATPHRSPERIEHRDVSQLRRALERAVIKAAACGPAPGAR